MKPIEVAVVGGGCASLAAAFELTRPEHRGRYHVTVYQVGWRLGGKGACGRGPAGRIEEHGLHLWMGFYENAFRLLRDCYAELGRDPARCRFADWRDAFEPAPVVSMVEPSESGEWSVWKGAFPTGDAAPGDPLTEHNPFTVRSYLIRAAELLRTLLESVRCRPGFRDEAAGAGSASPPSLDALFDAVSRLTRLGQLTSITALLEAVGLLEMAFHALSRYPQPLILRLIEAIGTGLYRRLESLIEDDVELRRLWEVVDLVLACLRGVFRFDLLDDPRGFDALDEYDWREWLELNGASARARHSALTRSLYDQSFAYEDGDPRRPRIAAGIALRSLVRMFLTYRGSFFWRMRAGMGDVVFAPYYEVLERRGVAFRFFHRLENVRIAEPSAPGERPYVEALELDVQAEIAGGGEYRPLIDVDGLPCWPSRPDTSQLVDGDRLEREGWDFESHWDRRKAASKTLRVGRDFDFVVLGVGIGAIPHVCREILARDRRWRRMVRHVKTTATQAFQLWLRAGMEELGWRGPAGSLTGFVDPFDTWADMRHLLDEERWPVRPAGLAYFCAVLPTPASPPDDDAYPAAERARVRDHAVRFLDREIRHLWPAATRGPAEFRWELLMDPEQAPGDDPAEGADASRFDSQHWTANVNPSDRYVLSVPGSTKHRISPLDNTYDNLTLAGDWTECGQNVGCVEAAVMSGRLAAHALSHSPPLEEIIGYDHP